MGQLRTGNKRQKRIILAAAQRHQRPVEAVQTPAVAPAEGSN
jgi:hypothetical protein